MPRIAQRFATAIVALLAHQRVMAGDDRQKIGRAVTKPLDSLDDKGASREGRPFIFGHATVRPARDAAVLPAGGDAWRRPPSQSR